MRVSHALLLAAGAASTSAAAIKYNASATIQQCAAAADGKLPYYYPSSFQYSGTVRRYYIAAEEVTWDYAPTGWDNWMGVPLSDSPRAKAAGATKFGTKWRKALYRGYTDDTFLNYTEQPPWQGTQGPTIRAEVGDMVEIMFVNKLTQNYATMHSMGLVYTKYSEGAAYPNVTKPGENDVLPVAEAVPPVEAGVSPGSCVVYKWLVDSANGPDYGEVAKTHSYHSYVSMEEDTNAGLIGPTIVYAQGKMNETMATHREIPLLYMIYDEAASFVSGQNSVALNNGNNSLALDSQIIYSGGNETVWRPQFVNYESAQQFPSAPSFYTMNGYIFANNPVFNMCLNDKVIWYVNAYGSASHVFHMHGSGYTINGGHAGYAVSLNDGVGKTLYQDATALGKWQVICHVNNHHSLGMVADYQIWQSGQCPLPALSAPPAQSSQGW